MAFFFSPSFSPPPSLSPPTLHSPRYPSLLLPFPHTAPASDSQIDNRERTRGSPLPASVLCASLSHSLSLSRGPRPRRTAVPKTLRWSHTEMRPHGQGGSGGGREKERKSMCVCVCVCGKERAYTSQLEKTAARFFSASLSFFSSFPFFFSIPPASLKRSHRCVLYALLKKRCAQRRTFRRKGHKTKKKKKHQTARAIRTNALSLSSPFLSLTLTLSAAADAYRRTARRSTLRRCPCGGTMAGGGTAPCHSAVGGRRRPLQRHPCQQREGEGEGAKVAVRGGCGTATAHIPAVCARVSPDAAGWAGERSPLRARRRATRAGDGCGADEGHSSLLFYNGFSARPSALCPGLLPRCVCVYVCACVRVCGFLALVCDCRFERMCEADRCRLGFCLHARRL